MNEGSIWWPISLSPFTSTFAEYCLILLSLSSNSLKNIWPFWSNNIAFESSKSKIVYGFSRIKRSTLVGEPPSIIPGPPLKLTIGYISPAITLSGSSPFSKTKRTANSFTAESPNVISPESVKLSFISVSAFLSPIALKLRPIGSPTSPSISTLASDANSIKLFVP